MSAPRPPRPRPKSHAPAKPAPAKSVGPPNRLRLPSPGQGTLQVSRATARFIAEGHPWVRPDRFTRGLEALRPGQAVTLVDDAGTRLASALADPKDEVCARVYHRKPDLAFLPAEALDRAWDRRAALHADPATDCYRLVHGEADFLPALRIERYGRVFVVLLLAECMAPHSDAVCRALAKKAAHIEGLEILVRDHKDDLRKEGVRTRRFVLPGALANAPVDAEAVITARELGITYPLRPFAGLATGLYVDQRATRKWLAPQASGARVLNLFAYTGAFSLHLLTSGAAHALDVDLAGPALKRAEEAAAFNGLGARHATVKADCRAYLAANSDLFDIIIVDPPTAAQGGDGWVLRRDYPEVLRLAFTRLAPGGLLLACCNTLGGKPYPLVDAVHEAARMAGVPTRDIASPPLGEDLPQIQGFPEGRPHRLVAVRRT